MWKSIDNVFKDTLRAYIFGNAIHCSELQLSVGYFIYWFFYLTFSKLGLCKLKKLNFNKNETKSKMENSYIFLERPTLSFSSYKNRKLKVKL